NFALERTQACDVDPIRGADHMREHVYLTESLFEKSPIGSRMGQNGPIAAGNIALLERVKPESSQLRRARCFSKASNSSLVTVTQCLVQQFPKKIVSPRGAHASVMQNIIRGDLGIRVAYFSEEMA